MKGNNGTAYKSKSSEVQCKSALIWPVIRIWAFKQKSRETGGMWSDCERKGDYELKANWRLVGPSQCFLARLVKMIRSLSGSPVKPIYLQSCRRFFFFHFPRSDSEPQNACFYARLHSDQAENKANPHPSHHPTAASQPQAAQRTHSRGQSTKPAVQPPAPRPPHPAPGSQASRGDGRGRAARVHPQGDRAERLRRLIQDACQRVRWSTR